MELPLAPDPAPQVQPARGASATWFRPLALALALGHLVLAWKTTGLRWEHVAADSLLALLPWLGKRGMAFAIGALPLWLTGVLYDNQWIWRNLVGSVHVALAERNLGILGPGGLDLPAWFNLHPAKVLDLFAGFAYSTHLLQLFGIGLFLFLVKPERFRGLAWAFLIANALGVVISTIYPAAPPWYVIAHGTGPVDPNAASSAGGALRFDALFGITYFRDFYSRNPFVWGAIASLHSAYPVLAAYAVWERGWRWRIPTLAYAMLMWFSALYLAHHYLLDVVIGIAIALVSSVIAHRVIPALRARWSARRRALPDGESDGVEIATS